MAEQPTTDLAHELTVLIEAMFMVTGHSKNSLREVVIGPNTVTFYEYAEDEQGRRFADVRTNKVAENIHVFRWNDERFWRGDNNESESSSSEPTLTYEDL